LLAECGGKNRELAEAIFPILLGLLRDSDSDVQETAEYCFDDLGSVFFTRILGILNKVDDHEIDIQVHLIRALGHFHYCKASSDLWPSAVRQLNSLLDHPIARIRGSVALTMAELGETSTPFIERLQRMSRSADPADRRGALKGLHRVTENRPALMPRLRATFLAALGDPDPTAREAVEWALRENGSSILAGLLKRLDDTSPAIRAHVIMTLSHFYAEKLPRTTKLQTARRLCNFFEDEDGEVRKAVAFAISDYLDYGDPLEAHEKWSSRIVQGIKHVFSRAAPLPSAIDPADVVHRLSKMCSAPTADERRAALHALWRIGQGFPGMPIREVLSAIAPNLKHDDAQVRKWAYDAYRYFDADDSAVISVLIQGVEDSSCDVAGTAAKALQDLSEKGADVSTSIPALCRALDRRECDRAAAIYSLFESACGILVLLPPDAVKSAIDPLERSLTSSSPRVVGAAAIALWKIDRRVDKSLPRLKQLLADGDMLPESFCDVLYQIGPAASALAPEVVALLSLPNWDAQWAAADALGEIASTDPGCVTALIAALQHPSGIVRSAAVRALSKIGKAAVPLLIRSLREGDSEMQEMAADALGVIGEDASEAAEDLKQLLNSADEGVRDWSAIALGKIAGSSEAIPTLMTILRVREGPNVRARAVEALGNIGARARSAVPLLRTLLGDPEDSVRSAAQEAIGRIAG
jgi:HEAT repeat protein